METILYDLYEGSIHPEESYRPQDAECVWARKKLAQKKQALLSCLPEEKQALLNEYFEEENEASAMEIRDSYIQGMRLGARLTAALLNK